jgi:hypothetical protein
MLQEESLSTAREQIAGWIGIGLIALLYTGLYVSNLWVPLSHSDYTIGRCGYSMVLTVQIT